MNKLKIAIPIIIIAGIIGMISWTAFDFANSKKDTSKKNDFNGGLLVADPDQQDDKDQLNGFGLERGKMAPDFELETLDGKSAKLSDYKGEKVIVNFWATWCPPCREEIPDLKMLYAKKDVEILAVNMTDTENNEEEIQTFVNDKFEMPFPVLMDRTSEVATTYKIAAYPTSYLIDTTGQIQFMAMGAMTYEQMVDLLDTLD
jgi:peroxiredoxin